MSVDLRAVALGFALGAPEHEKPPQNVPPNTIVNYSHTTGSLASDAHHAANHLELCKRIDALSHANYGLAQQLAHQQQLLQALTTRIAGNTTPVHTLVGGSPVVGEQHHPPQQQQQSHEPDPPPASTAAKQHRPRKRVCHFGRRCRHPDSCRFQHVKNSVGNQPPPGVERKQHDHHQPNTNERDRLRIETAAQQNMGPRKQLAGVCYGCGQTGHQSRDCPRNGGAGKSGRQEGSKKKQLEDNAEQLSKKDEQISILTAAAETEARVAHDVAVKNEKNQKSSRETSAAQGKRIIDLEQQLEQSARTNSARIASLEEASLKQTAPLHAECSSLKSQLAEAQKKNDAANNTISVLNSKTTDLEQQLEQSTALVANLRNINHELQHRRLEEKADATAAALDDKHTIAEAQKKNRANSKTITNLNGKSFDLEQQLIQTKHFFRAEAQRADEATDALGEAQKRIDLLEQKAADEKKAANERKINSMEDQQQAQRTEIQEKDQQINNLTALVETRDKWVAQDVERLNLAWGTVIEHQKTIADLEEALAEEKMKNARDRSPSGNPTEPGRCSPIDEDIVGKEPRTISP
jgi:chromosome segregation ATPase